MAEAPDTTDLLEQLGDELMLHAWLRAAEFRNPSLEHAEARNEIDALVRIRDEFRVQMHLGRMEATDEFHSLEGTWRKLKQAAARAEDHAEERLSDLVKQLRDGYNRFSK